MTGPETALWALVWLVGLVWLVRWPIVTSGCLLALVVASWHPAAFWLCLAATAAASLGWRFWGPEERLFGAYPELAVVLGAGLAAVLVGGHVAAAALAVVVLALARLVTVLTGYRWSSRDADRVSERPAGPSAAFLGRESWRVDFGPCPSCGGLLVASGRPQLDVERGRVFVAQAICTACGLRLDGLGDLSAPQRGVTWIPGGTIQ